MISIGQQISRNLRWVDGIGLILRNQKGNHEANCRIMLFCHRFCFLQQR